VSGGGKGGISGPLPIIIKWKKAGHAGAHGGAWKVAYADFVTAMMAFFLLLWLLNVSSKETKSAIADYFTPFSMAQTTSGGGGFFGGKTQAPPGANKAPVSALTTFAPDEGLPGLSAVSAENATTKDEPEFQEQPTPPAPGELQNPDLKAAMTKLSAAVDEFSKDMEMLRDSYPQPRPDENRSQFQQRLQKAAERLGQPGQRAGETLSEFATRVDEAARKASGEKLALAAAGVGKTVGGGVPGSASGSGAGAGPGSGSGSGAGAGSGAGSGSGGSAGGAGSGAGAGAGAGTSAGGVDGTGVGAAGSDSGERQQFVKIAQDLRQAVAFNPQLKEMGESLMVDIIPDGLRIQLADQDKLPMFPTGSTDMGPQARALLDAVAAKVRGLPNRITVTGHTDNRPFRAGSSRDNWDLSAKRAAATLRQLEAAGVSSDRFDTIVGRADREPLVANRPDAAVNRRVTIIVHNLGALPGG